MPEGRIVNTAGAWAYEYEYRDIMGNLRASYKKDNGVLKIVQLSDYDAFGFEHYRNTIFSGNTPQQYRYQNQLKIDDFDIGWEMFKFRASDNQLGRFFRVDPKADQREWLSPYNFASNNPINRIDPDGNMDFGVNDWLKMKDGSVKFDAAINNQAQATAKYGAGTTDLGASATLMSNAGNQLSLSSNGTASNATMLNEVSVTAKSSNSTLGSINDAFGLSNDAHAGVVAGAKMLDNVGDAAQGFATVGKALDVIGKFSGITGALVSAKDAYVNPSVGNISKLVLDIGLVGVKSTTVGLIDGVLSVTGIKDAGFKYIDNQVDKYQFNQVINSQKLDPTKFKIK